MLRVTQIRATSVVGTGTTVADWGEAANPVPLIVTKAPGEIWLVKLAPFWTAVTVTEWSARSKFRAQEEEPRRDNENPFHLLLNHFNSIIGYRS